MTAWTPRQRAMLAEMGITVWNAPGAAVTADALREPPAAGDTVSLAAITERAAVVAVAAGALGHASPADTPSAPPRPVLPTARSGAAPSGACPPVVDDLGWADLQGTAAVCTACDLHRGRTHSVFGQGRRGAHWLIVGDPPDDADDAAGTPFAGPPGHLLDNMLRAVGVFRAGDEVDGPADAVAASLTTVVKCRPPDGRPPTAADVVTCRAYLARQLQLLQPRIVLAMGRWAARSLLDSDEPLGRLRGTVHTAGGVPVVVTYDPAYLLRNPQDKAKAWADLCLAADTVAA